ncbi:MAG: MBL fold metallo-hydrolase [Bryobacterales bacterium]|nr:MBL fold metallo-hydrolase [Bryobacteraceae bacterium]MDW8355800.1 MBL fold metallo-hydrolase [Bryobacterales bacterium]
MRKLASWVLLATAAASSVKRPVEEFPASGGTVRITPVRHGSLMIEAGGQVIHVDPWSQGNYEGLPQADIILITDTHGDHLDRVMIQKLKKPHTVVIGPPAVAKALEDVAAVTVLRNGETTKIGAWTIEAVPMYNLKRGPAEGKFYHDKGRGNGYVVTWGGKRFYISGDTEGVPEMRALQNIDVAFVCMNLPFTMPPEEAADAVKAFRPKIVYPYHYRGSDLSVFEHALKGTGIEVRIRDWYY